MLNRFTFLASAVFVALLFVQMIYERSLFFHISMKTLIDWIIVAGFGVALACAIFFKL